MNSPHETLLEDGREVLRIEAGELMRLAETLDEHFVEVVLAMRDCVQAGLKIVVLGVGKSGQVGEKIASTLTSTGAPSVVLNPLNALHGDLGMVAEGDLVLALSQSGETEELLRILPPLKHLTSNLVAMTASPTSSLGKAARIVLPVRVQREACPLNLAPTASTTAMLAMGDALAMALLKLRGFTESDFAKFHPAGHLGKTLLLRVADIMRGLDEIACCSPSSSVLEALKVMSRHRAGAALAVDDSGVLLGIFTHGDFARTFQLHPDAAGRPIAEFMTKNPSTIHADRLAVEVVTVLATKRIDELPVVDEAGRVAGLVDSQDLARHRLV